MSQNNRESAENARNKAICNYFKQKQKKKAVKNSFRDWKGDFFVFVFVFGSYK